ncbi:sugar transporter ERD6-like 16 isoform X2 [Oryza brachyantha]|uniref:Major facilitator superfamily (MFS) profile domain-containing protein n=1 Tax=Oryza brachyantha TaxID=4533 RepID=J3N9U7_ORYBR|nr:sugar transporter ERD6-like 16 isoform X2 [Oryza brachyantha]
MGASSCASEPLLPRPGGDGSLAMVIASTGVAVLGSFVFGVSIGYSAPTQSKIREDLQLSLSEYSVFGSIITIGAMIGAVASGHLADVTGRKGAMRASALACIVGWLAIFFAQSAVSLDFGRFCTGFGVGVFSYVVPVFIAEIAPKALRGGLTTLNQLLVCTGLSVTYIVGTMVTWRMLVIAGLVPSIALIIGLFFIPESPRWLAKVGRQKEFEIALQRLRGKDADVSIEAAEIKEFIETIENLPKAGVQDLFNRAYIRPAIVGVGLMVFQQFVGINGILFYASETFVSAGFASGDLGTILMGCIQAPITAVGALLMDRSGRRPLLLISTSGLLIGSLMSAISFYLKIHGLFLEQVPIIALTGILIYIASYSIGMGAVPWVIMSEIFPINIKGIGGSFVTLVNWSGSWAVSFAFNFFMSWSSSGTFFVFALVCAVAILFIVKAVPETKGKTLEEIQASMNSSST